MRVFMVVTNPVRALAWYTTRAFEWATGFHVEHRIGLPDPYLAKLQLPDDRQYMVIDADLVFLTRWSVPKVPLGTFAAAPAQLYARDVLSVEREYGVSRERFINSGLFIADSYHRPVFQRAQELYPKQFRSREETPLNIALQEQNTPFQRLYNVNQQHGYHPAVASVHPVTLGSISAKLAEAKRVLWHHGDPALRELLKLEEQPSVLPEKVLRG